MLVDFAICAEGDRLVPRLIELQAFPSLFGFQLVLLDCIRKAYPVIPRNWTSSFGGIKDDAYLELLRRTIIADSPIESVVLLDIEPEKQKTRVDFAATETFLGIRPVCVTKIKKRGRQLFYDRDGREVRIERIYNRVIFDELSQRSDLNLQFRFQDDLDVSGLIIRTGISGSASIRCRFSKPSTRRRRFSLMNFHPTKTSEITC